MSVARKRDGTSQRTEMPPFTGSRGTPSPPERLAGAICVAIGVVGVAVNFVLLKLTQEYWPVLFVLGAPVFFGGAVLLLLPAGPNRSRTRVVLARVVLGLALLIGLLVGALLTWDPLAALKWAGFP
jgi:drug/metabolite transporter (DMT)-like permease